MGVDMWSLHNGEEVPVKRLGCAGVDCCLGHAFFARAGCNHVKSSVCHNIPEAARELRLLLALQEHNLVVVVIYHAADVGMISVGTPAQDHDPQDVLSVRAFCSPSCSPQ